MLCMNQEFLGTRVSIKVIGQVQIVRSSVKMNESSPIAWQKRLDLNGLRKDETGLKDQLLAVLFRPFRPSTLGHSL